MAKYKERARQAAASLSKVVTDGVIDGAAVGAGLVGAGWLGRTVEDTVKKGVTKDSTITDKLIAWGANAVPKLGLWYLAYRMMPESETLPKDKEGNVSTEVMVVSDLRKAMLGSFILDGMMRASKSFGSPDKVTIFGINFMGNGSPEMTRTGYNPNPELQNNLQRVIQENSALRTELNKALKRTSELTSARQQPQITAPQQVQVQQVQPQVQYQQPPVVRVQPVVQMQQPVVQQVQQPVVQNVVQAPPVIQRQPIMAQVPGEVTSEREKKYGFMETEPVAERERKYGFAQNDTTPPVVRDRQRSYGFMDLSEKSVASKFGML